MTISVDIRCCCLRPPRQLRLVGSLAAMPSSRNNVHVVAFKRDKIR